MCSPGGGVPSVLQEVQVPVIENSVCQEMFQTSGHAKNIISSFLCAGYANGQRDSCEVSGECWRAAYPRVSHWSALERTGACVSRADCVGP